MDDISVKRQQLKEAYDNNPTWVSKVNKMNDGQVVAVYFRFKSKNKI